MKKKKVLILVLLFIILSATIFLVNLINSKNNNKTIEDIENDTIEKQYIIEQEKIDDLLDNLGNGVSGNIKKVEEETNEEGNKTYTYTFIDNTTQTITIRKATEEELADIDSKNDNQDIVEEDDINNENNDEDIPEEDLGTVFERYQAMSSEEQLAFYLSFENPEDFYKWYDSARQEYDSLHPAIVIGEDEIIEIGERTNS